MPSTMQQSIVKNSAISTEPWERVMIAVMIWEARPVTVMQPPMKTAFNASKLAIGAFVVPYIFALNPAMLLIDTTPFQVVIVVVTSIVGIFGVAAALNGFLRRPLHPLLRVVIGLGGLLMMDPSTLTDVVGVVMLAAVLVFQAVGANKAAAQE